MKFVILLLGTALFLYGDAAAQENAIPKLAMAMRENLASFPNCAFEYTFKTDPGKGSMAGGPVTFRYQFVQQDGRFSFKRWFEDTELPDEWTTFDGEKYYRYLGGNLTAGRNSDAEQLKKPLSSLFAGNPLTAAYYHCLFSGHERRFFAPEFSNPKVWLEVFQNVSAVNEKELVMTWPNRKRVFELSKDALYPTRSTLIPIPDSGVHVTTEVTKWTALIAQGRPLRIPEEIVQVVTKNGAVERESVKITLHPDTFRLLVDKQGIENFRVPVAIARRFFDSDLQTSISR